MWCIFLFLKEAAFGIEDNFKGHYIDNLQKKKKKKIRQNDSLLKSPNFDATNFLKVVTIIDV